MAVLTINELYKDGPPSDPNEPAKNDIRDTFNAKFATLDSNNDAVDLLTPRVTAAEAEIDALQAITGAGILYTPNTVHVRATANINTTTGLTNGTVLNGVTLVTGQHVFLPAQTVGATITYANGSTNSPQNGIYTVVASGTAARATWADTPAKLALIGFAVAGGAVGSGEAWTLPLAAGSITLGTTFLPFSLLPPQGAAGEVSAARVGANKTFGTLDLRLDDMENDTLGFRSSSKTVQRISYTDKVTVSKIWGRPGINSVTGFAGQAQSYVKAGLGIFNAVTITRAERNPAAYTGDWYKWIIEVRETVASGQITTGVLMGSGELLCDPDQNKQSQVTVALTAPVDPATASTANLNVICYPVDRDGNPCDCGQWLIAQTAGTFGVTNAVGLANTTWYRSRTTGLWNPYAAVTYISIELHNLTSPVKETVDFSKRISRVTFKDQEFLFVPPEIPFVLGGGDEDLYLENFVQDALLVSKVDVTSSVLNKGQVQERRYTLPATGAYAMTAGTTTLTVRAKDPLGNGQIATKTCNVKTVAANAGGGVNRAVLFFGDSITEQGGEPAGTVYSDIVRAVKNLAAADAANMPLTFLGLRGSAGERHEAVSGSTIVSLESIFTNFVFGGVFNFSTWAAAQTPANPTVDAIVLTFGANSIAVGAIVTPDDARAQAAFDAARYEEVIVSVKAYAPACKIIINAIVPASASNDAFGVSYGGEAPGAQSADADLYHRKAIAYNNGMFDKFAYRDEEGIYFRAPGLCIDRRNMFPRTRALANANTPIGGTHATYAAMLANLTPANGELWYVTDIADYYVKVGATTSGAWRRADEFDGVVWRENNGLHMLPFGKAAIGRSIWFCLKSLW